MPPSVLIQKTTKNDLDSNKNKNISIDSEWLSGYCFYLRSSLIFPGLLATSNLSMSIIKTFG